MYLTMTKYFTSQHRQRPPGNVKPGNRRIGSLGRRAFPRPHAALSEGSHPEIPHHSISLSKPHTYIRSTTYYILHMYNAYTSPSAMCIIVVVVVVVVVLEIGAVHRSCPLCPLSMPHLVARAFPNRVVPSFLPSHHQAAIGQNPTFTVNTTRLGSYVLLPSMYTLLYTIHTRCMQCNATHSFL